MTVDSTTLGLSRGDRLVLIVGSPVVGLLLGLVTSRVIRWASEQPLPLLKGPLRLLAAWQGQWATTAWAGLGIAAGIAFVITAFNETTAITLTDDEVRLRKNGRTATVSRADVSATYLDGKHLVLVDQRGEQLMRETHDTQPAKVADAFRQHGWPWSETPG